MTPCLFPLRTTTDRGDRDDTDADADDTDRRCKMTTFFFFQETTQDTTLTPKWVIHLLLTRFGHHLALAIPQQPLQSLQLAAQLQVALEVGDTPPETHSGLGQMRGADVLVILDDRCLRLLSSMSLVLLRDLDYV